MRKFATLSLLAIGALMGVAEAQSCCNDCCYSGTYVGAEWLYLRSYGVDQSFGIARQTSETNLTKSDLEVRCIEPDYSSGVRVWLGYDDPCSCWGVRGDYLYYDSSDRARLRGLDNDTTYDVAASSCIDYQKVSVEVTGELTNCNCPFILTGFVGMGWAEVNHKRLVKAVTVDSGTFPFTTDSINRERSYFSGIGPRAGLDFVWEVPCYSCLALRATFAAILLVSKTKADSNSVTVFTQDTAPPTERFSSDKLVDCYRLFPSLEAKIGLQGTWACGCTQIMGEIGYRADYYTNALDVPNTFSSRLASPNASAAEEVDGQVFDGAGFRTLRNDVGFGGLYLGVQVGF